MTSQSDTRPRRKPDLYLCEACIAAPNSQPAIERQPFEPAKDLDLEGFAADLAGHPEEIDSRDERGRTWLLRLAGLASAEVIRIVVDAGADVNARDVEGTTALHAAAWVGHERGVEELLAAGAVADAQDEEGMAPLHWAARNGHIGTMLRLIAGGANPRLASQEGAEPLSMAALLGQVEACRVLLAVGADPFAKGADGVTPFSGARQLGHPAVLELFLFETSDVFVAIDDGDHERLGAILRDHPERIHAHNDCGLLPLHYAAFEGGPEAVRILLDAGAYPNARDVGGMHVLQTTSSDDTAELLLRRGADPNTHIERIGSLLHLAIGNQGKSRVRLLLEAGADPTVKDSQGRSCLDLARERGDQELIALVESHVRATENSP